MARRQAPVLTLAVLAAWALAGGLILQQLSCSLLHACLQVALEFQLEGREQFSAEDFWRGALGYGLGLWMGLQLGWFVCRGRSWQGHWRTVALSGALGVLLGLFAIYGLTASRWGIDLPQPVVPPGTGPEPSRPEHIALEWPGADHIPDALEWWILVLFVWLIALFVTGWALRRPTTPQPARR